MKRFFPLACLLFCLLSVRAQLPFKNDNVVYKAIYLNDAFKMMDAERDFLLLDVRSPGEYADTSRFTALNIGRLRGAVNIDVDAVEGRLDELTGYKEKPVFIYCSHSQRSRRISKLLSEKGFRQVYNINGGMSVVNLLDANRFPYKTGAHETNTMYKNVASVDAAKLIRETPGLVIIDIRNEQAFQAKDTLLQNNIGRFRNAINIPQASFAEKLDAHKIPADKPVLVYDLHGQNSMDVMATLRSNGFTRLYNLYGGLETFSADHAVGQWRSDLLTGSPAYKLVNPQAAIALLTSQPNTLVVDTRTVEEFQNKTAVAYHNLGQIKNAVNLHSPELLEKWMQEQDRNKPVLVYGGMSGNAAVKTALALAGKGFKQVHLLSQGLYRFVWATHNLDDCKGGKALLTNHEGLY